MDLVPDLFRRDTSFGFLDKSVTAEKLFNPMLVSNFESNTMYKTILEELRRSKSFTFSVAFVSPDAIASLKQPLIEFPGRGRIITSTYLGFNSPASFRELANLRDIGIEVLVYENGRQGFHPKGFIFDQEHGTTAIVGSSNLTSLALKRNHEWNLRFSALPGGDIVEQLSDAIDTQLSSSTLLTDEWIRRYEEQYVPPQAPRTLSGVPVPGAGELSKIHPNAMQAEALEEIAKVRSAGEKKALVVSATGTGKTILAALDVKAAAPKRVLFVVHREQILDRAREEFRKVLNLPDTDIGKFVGARKELDRRFVFATVQSLGTLDKLRQIPRDYFDYILVDEVHRAGAAMHQNIIGYFEPDFMLGITATPERTDDFNVYSLFDYNVPYEIRLQKALEEDMLAPFHYYGVTDFEVDGEVISDASKLNTLIAPDRVNHLLKAIETYGHVGDSVRGLMFCSRKDEAIELSALLNQREVHGSRLRTRTLTGDDPVPVREAVVSKLEAGELDYIITVDVFNEGIDIRTVNQVVMLRQTQSSIIFTQQLGRGLRKAAGKSHLIVIDFIGNYANNFLVPIALFGDSSLNKDSIRKKMIEAQDVGTVPGLSSVNFDAIAKERIFRSIDAAKIDGKRHLKKVFREFKDKIGRTPQLIDYATFDVVDPVVIANADGNYWNLLSSFKEVEMGPPLAEGQILTFLSRELLNGKRPQELILLNYLLGENDSITVDDFKRLLERSNARNDDPTIRSVRRILSLDFFTSADRLRYAPRIVDWESGLIRLSSDFKALYLGSSLFARSVADTVDTGLFLSRHRYRWDRQIEVGKKYSRKDVCRLLNWEDDLHGVVNGYWSDDETLTCPIFVNYVKEDDISEGTKYEDEFVSEAAMKWFSKRNRKISSGEIKKIISGDYRLLLFVKKNTKEGSDYYYLGEVEASDPVQTTQPSEKGRMEPIVTMKLTLDSPVEFGLYDYLTSSSGGESRRVEISSIPGSLSVGGALKGERRSGRLD